MSKRNSWRARAIRILSEQLLASSQELAREAVMQIWAMSPDLRADRDRARELLARLRNRAQNNLPGGWACFRAAEKAAKEQGLLARERRNPNVVRPTTPFGVKLAAAIAA